MSGRDPQVDAWVRDVLAADGAVPFARVIQSVLDVEELRRLARRFAIAPKGYRPERAPAARLAPLLVDGKRPEVVTAVCETFVTALRTRVVAAAPPPVISVDDARSEELERRRREIDDLRQELERCRQQTTRQREREARLTRDLQTERQRVASQRAELERARLAIVSPPRDVGGAREADRRRIHDLERELATEGETVDDLRRRVAERQARVRSLEAEVDELTALVPKGRRKKEPPPPAPPLADQFRVPHFTPAFYKSLEGKTRRSVEQAMQAILLFCTEGPGYPGLEVKQIEGQELWSLRASLKLRVYFRLRDDGDADFLMLADREDQNTALRRLKER